MGESWAFFAAAAEAMRRILIDNAWRKNCLRHGSGMDRVNLDDLGLAASMDDEQLLALNEALDHLTEHDAEKAQVVKLRFTALVQAPVDPVRPLDGVNLMPYLTGENPGSPHDTIYLRIFDRGAYAVRSGDYKLVIPAKGNAPELFNLKQDINEASDISEAHTNELQSLDVKRMVWNAQLIPPVFGGLWVTKPAKDKTDGEPAKAED